jgi:3-oxoacyl-[acyl-carrier protein] reductase
MAQHYVIIGGTSGIGAGIATRLIESGARVTTISRRDHGLQVGEHISLDVTSEEIPVERIEGKISGIAYCPGSINLRPFRSISESDFQADWNVNVLGAFKALKALAPRLDKANDASIVLFSTVAVQQGMPFHASVAASKGAVEGLTRALAAELAPDIRVNCIAPSLTNTPMAERLLANEARRKNSEERHPLKRIGTVEDISELAVFLLGDKSSWISGQVIGVDGGMSSLRV